MVKVLGVYLKSGEFIDFNPEIDKVRDTTFFDFQTQGKKARKNVIRVIKDNSINVEDVKIVVFDTDYYHDFEVEMYE